MVWKKILYFSIYFIGFAIISCGKKESQTNPSSTTIDSHCGLMGNAACPADSSTSQNTALSPPNVSTGFQIKGILSAGAALKNASVLAQDAAGRSYRAQSITSASGAYQLDFDQEPQWPVLVYVIVANQHYATLVQTKKEQIKHLNPMTTAVVENLIGSQFPNIYQTPLAQLPPNAYSEKGTQWMQRLFTGKISFGFFDLDPHFVANSPTSLEAPSLGDLLIESFQDYASHQKQSLSLALSESSNVLSHLIFQRILALGISISPGSFSPDYLTDSKDPLVNELLSLRDAFEPLTTKMAEAHFDLAQTEIGSHAILAAVEESLVILPETQQTNELISKGVETTTLLLTNQILSSIPTHQKLLGDDIKVQSIVENAAKQSGYAIGVLGVLENIESNHELSTAVQTIFTDTTALISNKIQSPSFSSLNQALTEVQTAVQNTTVETLTSLQHNDSVGEPFHTNLTTQLARITTLPEVVTPPLPSSTNGCTMPLNYLLVSTENPSESTNLILSSTLPPSPGRLQVSTPQQVTLAQQKLTWVAGNPVKASGYSVLHCGQTTEYQWKTHTFRLNQTSLTSVDPDNSYLILPYQTVPLPAVVAPFSKQCLLQSSNAQCYGDFASVNVKE